MLCEVQSINREQHLFASFNINRFHKGKLPFGSDLLLLAHQLRIQNCKSLIKSYRYCDYVTAKKLLRNYHFLLLPLYCVVVVNKFAFGIMNKVGKEYLTGNKMQKSCFQFNSTYYRISLSDIIMHHQNETMSFLSYSKNEIISVQKKNRKYTTTCRLMLHFERY